jgi:hypothetical protein
MRSQVEYTGTVFHLTLKYFIDGLMMVINDGNM